VLFSSIDRQRSSAASGIYIIPVRISVSEQNFVPSHSSMDSSPDLVDADNERQMHEGAPHLNRIYGGIIPDARESLRLSFPVAPPFSVPSEVHRESSTVAAKELKNPQRLLSFHPFAIHRLAVLGRDPRLLPGCSREP
jgi:hypothetical protein